MTMMSGCSVGFVSAGLVTVNVNVVIFTLSVVEVPSFLSAGPRTLSHTKMSNINVQTKIPLKFLPLLLAFL